MQCVALIWIVGQFFKWTYRTFREKLGQFKYGLCNMILWINIKFLTCIHDIEVIQENFVLRDTVKLFSGKVYDVCSLLINVEQKTNKIYK